MKENGKTKLKNEFRQLWRSMDFVSRHPSLDDEHSSEGKRFAELYQQLGALWEFLGLQCRHWDGYRKNGSDKLLCKICGKVRGLDEYWFLIPRQGAKRIGRHTVPSSKETFSSKRAARVIEDAIDFHGTRLAVNVQNAYRSRLIGHEITVAADRIVRLEEGAVEFEADTHTVRIKLTPRSSTSAPPYGSFPWELPRRLLKQFPILLEYDSQDRFVGVTIFKQGVPPKSRKTTAPARRGS